MKLKAVLRGSPSVLAALGINAIPAGIVLVGGESAGTAMVLYFLENLLLILFTAARVRLLAPAHDEAYAQAAPDLVLTRIKDRVLVRKESSPERRALLAGYLTFSLSFSAGTGVFLFMFLFLIVRASISSTIVASGIAGIAAFQLFDFGADFLLRGRLSPSQALMLVEGSMGRVALLYLAVAVGALLTLAVERWFVLPFAVLKTIADLAMLFRGTGTRDRRPDLG